MFSLISTLLSLFSTALLVYCILSFVAPNSRLMEVLRPYADTVLNPFRKLIFSLLPGLENLGMDFSPVLLCLVIVLIRRLLGIFL